MVKYKVKINKSKVILWFDTESAFEKFYKICEAHCHKIIGSNPYGMFVFCQNERFRYRPNGNNLNITIERIK